MQVDVEGVPTARYDAVPVVATQHQTTDRRWDGLDSPGCFGFLHAPVSVDRPYGHAPVGAQIETTELLCIAGCHLDDFRRDLNRLTTTL